jgi:hypothetical protein
MPTNRPVKRLIALVLTTGAVVGGAQIGTQAVGAQPVNATTDNQGNPSAVPPILRPARPSELAQIRRAEAQERAKFYYRPPAGARYSNAEMDAFASEGCGES